MKPAVSGVGYDATTTVAPYVIRPGRASVRPTFQLGAQIVVPGSNDPHRVLTGAAGVALKWLGAKFPEKLPLSAFQLDSFDLDHHGLQQLTCVAIPEDGLWSVRLVQPDAPFRDRAAVAGRTWTTELALRRDDGQVTFGIRVLCASAPYAAEAITLTRPRVVVDLAQRFGLHEIRQIDGKPWMLSTEEDLQSLHDLLTNQARTLPVILLTQPDRAKWPVPVADYLLDHHLLAQTLQGFAHVVCMPMKLGFGWTTMVGKVWSTFHGAVRTYQPHLDFASDSPFDHPRVLPDRILFWRHNGLESEAGFASFLIERVQEQAATKVVDWGNCLFLADARSRRAALARERIRNEVSNATPYQNDDSEWRTKIARLEHAYHEQIEALSEQLREAQANAEDYENLAAQYSADREQALRFNHNLQLQNDGLRIAVASKTDRGADAGISIPENFDDMPEWADRHFTGRLTLHPRALQGIKNATYTDVGTVYKSLQLLADSYRNTRLGHPDSTKRWEEGLATLGLRFSGSITKERAGEQGETYFVRYPMGTSPRRFLEYHLRKGSTKDDRYCMGIYFFWDEDRQVVVVGWLPSHLDTRAT